MYTQYFGLSERPFSIAPDPHFLYLSELHKEALAHLLYGMEGGGCLVLLTGDVGTGKTTVSRALLEQLPDETDIALILNPRLSEVELLTAICGELRIGGIPAPASVKQLVDCLNRHLLDTHAQGRNTILIIDEAQDLAPDVLEQLRLLTNLETTKEKLLKIILLGQPELKERLNRPEFAQINQRITSRYHLLPLQEADVFAYIEHRVRVAGGGRGQLFSVPAMRRINDWSHGIPRLINLLCERALIGAYVEEKDQVDRGIVERAGREVLGRSGPPARRRACFFPSFPLQPVLALSLLLALVCAGTALYLFSGLTTSKPPAGRMPTVAQELLQAHTAVAPAAQDEGKAPLADKKKAGEHTAATKPHATHTGQDHPSAR